MTETAHFAKNWQQQLAQAFTNIDDLCRYLDLNPSDLAVSTSAAQQFALRVPLSFAASMEKGNPHDPLLRQVLPITDELVFYAGYTNDPVGDLPAATQTGILHKYRGRVLLINTGSCAINCRYCFRRNFPYADLQLSKQQEHAAILSIQNDPSIHEVIFSGGDPLLLNDARLTRLIEQINQIDHIKRIRIHSRLPIVLPARITPKLIHTLTESPKQIILVLHCNHTNELNQRVITACQQLKKHGITLLNQSVLLKGVNDDAAVLCELSERLFQHGVIPYYLHLLDKATGTGHFAVSETEALLLMERVQASLSGYLVPKLVKEVAGAESKRYVVG
ncbi:MAG: EF-P beta-lysylation protein EpmB [Methylococcales bacterium]|nr:EF-P beta-lysylation protein EpmB [Methylococcales bacterium]